MPLVPCPDCGHFCSDSAFSCPICGRPMAVSVVPSKRPMLIEHTGKGPKLLLLAGIAVSMLGFWLLLGLSVSEPDWMVWVRALPLCIGLGLCGAARVFGWWKHG